MKLLPCESCGEETIICERMESGQNQTPAHGYFLQCSGLPWSGCPDTTGCFDTVKELLEYCAKELKTTVYRSPSVGG